MNEDIKKAIEKSLPAQMSGILQERFAEWENGAECDENGNLL